MLAAVSLIVRFRATQRAPALALSADMPVGGRVRAVVGRASAIMAAAAIAGLLVPGLGGRLLMRLLAATSPEAAQGLVTDADEVVGVVTAGGTVFLVLIVGLSAGMIGAFLFTILRRWLPTGSINAGVVSAGIGGGLIARPSGLLDPGNHDFVILSPAWLAVFTALTVIIVFGMSFAVLADRWAGRWPAIGRSPRGILALVPIMAMSAIAVAGVLPAIVLIITLGVAVFLRPHLPALTSDRVNRVGSRTALLLGSIGGAWMIVSSIQILRL